MVCGIFVVPHGIFHCASSDPLVVVYRLSNCAVRAFKSSEFAFNIFCHFSSRNKYCLMVTYDFI